MAKHLIKSDDGNFMVESNTMMTDKQAYAFFETRQVRCSCIDVVPQSQECYDRMIVLEVPEWLNIRINNTEHEKTKWVSVDPCIAGEVWELWQHGIITTGSCCGHNLGGRCLPYIGVIDEHIPLMKELGYEVQTNTCGQYDEDGNFIQSYPEREDSFNPYSI